MLKIIKLSRNIGNLRFVRYSSSWRHQFKTDQPIYYPKRDLTERDELKASLQVQEQALKAMIPSIDYYKILGIEKVASTQEIKTAYYNLAKKFHPDANPTPQETKSFQEISEAYHVLSDENNRSEYDRCGYVKNAQPYLNTIALAENKSIGGKKLPQFLSFFKKEKVNDQLETRVALKDVQNINNRNEMEMTLKFLQAVHGMSEYVNLKAMIKCPRCNGATRNGSQANIEFCQKCGGTGQYRTSRDKNKYRTCDSCDGKRYVNRNSCKTCENRGFVVKSRRVEVKVPPGAQTGDIVKVNNPVNNQVVKIRLNVEKSSYFKRTGYDIHTDKYLTISQAVLGGKFKIRGLYEELEVNLGPGIDSHTTHCFKQKGVHNQSGTSGDHTVTFKIRIPKALTTKQRQLMLALARTEDPAFDGQS